MPIATPQLRAETFAEVARRLRQILGRASALVVAMTGHAKEPGQALPGSAGIDHYLVKPVEVSTVQALVERHKGRAGGRGPDNAPAGQSSGMTLRSFR
ncbi:MAG TPA: hypothetical protein VIL46_09110 [Gemmataceae bacterium]